MRTLQVRRCRHLKLFSPFNNLLADTDNICWPADVGFVFVKNTCNTTSPDARVAVDVRPVPCLVTAALTILSSAYARRSLPGLAQTATPYVPTLDSNRVG